MRKNVNKVKSLWPGAKGNIGCTENECGSWNLKLITEWKLYHILLFAFFFLYSIFLPCLMLRPSPVTLVTGPKHMRPYRRALGFCSPPLQCTWKKFTFDWHLKSLLSPPYLIIWRPEETQTLPYMLTCYLTVDSNQHDRPPSTSSPQILNNMWHEKIKSLTGEMLLCCQQMAASARWAYGEHQSTLLAMFDEVSVCVLSAVYSSWPLSHGTPSDTYGGNLFKFFSKERNKWGENSLGILGLEISLRGWDYR